MFELELHDWLPYLFSISLLCTIAYSYTIHLRESTAVYLSQSAQTEVWVTVVPQFAFVAMAVGLWLIRYVKRKAAPDDDDSECGSSLDKQDQNQRGGLLCPATKHSHSYPVRLRYGSYS
ncbi:hypothetical protein RB620_11780 [Paenibacillus sp. LHD-117]|uniref:hypothetical protein n=1 Tax=Paenibacillus sp. LHD-117 TaxID=3071412 RepID=UPI0027DEF74F|nr:hypothetical protein [Paenibacillus sp. LHD-117]MDQ6420117.1 hypothetical protein [Paenibacillus sp. LHD-117]